MTIINQIKPSLIAYYTAKAFRTFYPNVSFTTSSTGTFERLLESNPKNLIIYNGGCDQTIYPRPQDNYLARAWHDSVHIQNNLGFSKADEIKAARIQVEQLRTIKAPTIVINAIWFDIVGQIEYYYSKKKYVKNQRQFVQNCLDHGIEYAINQTYWQEICQEIGA